MPEVIPGRLPAAYWVSVRKSCVRLAAFSLRGTWPTWVSTVLTPIPSLSALAAGHAFAEMFGDLRLSSSERRFLALLETPSLLHDIQ
jgi:hypothetical protein